MIFDNRDQREVRWTNGAGMPYATRTPLEDTPPPRRYVFALRDLDEQAKRATKELNDSFEPGDPSRYSEEQIKQAHCDYFRDATNDLADRLDEAFHALPWARQEKYLGTPARDLRDEEQAAQAKGEDR